MIMKESDYGLVFVGVLLFFLGLGQLYGRPDAGILVGLGLGFLATFYFKYQEPRSQKANPQVAKKK